MHGGRFHNASGTQSDFFRFDRPLCTYDAHGCGSLIRYFFNVLHMTAGHSDAVRNYARDALSDISWL